VQLGAAEEEGFEPSARSCTAPLIHDLRVCRARQEAAQPLAARTRAPKRRLCAARCCGGGGIRTHGTLASTPVFKTGALNRSATPPSNWRRVGIWWIGGRRSRQGGAGSLPPWLPKLKCRVACLTVGSPTPFASRGASRPHRVQPLELLARLAGLVPSPRHPLVRFHGVLAPHTCWRARIWKLRIVTRSNARVARTKRSRAAAPP
jgi:hypothetical protein